MSEESALQKILESVGALRKDFGSMSKDVDSLQETVHFLKDNMASKTDLERFATKDDLERFATKDDLSQLRSDLMSHIDGFVGLHKNLDIEHNALRSKVNRMEKEFLDFRGQQLGTV